MQIKHIEIKSFAGLKDYELNFFPGFNCFYGPNERGKSTIIQFILAMFYGLGDRRAKNNLRDKLTPRDGSAMSGSIWFKHRGRDYELNRKFGDRSGLDQTTLLDLGSNKQVDLENFEQPGYELFGLSREVFQNTLFIDASGPEVKQDNLVNNEIWQNLIDFMVNDDAEVSVQQVEDRLSQEFYNYKSKSGKKGIIPELEAQYQSLVLERENRLANFNNQNENLEKLASKEEDLIDKKEKQKLLSDKLRVIKLSEDIQTLELLNEPHIMIDKLKREEEELQSSLEHIGNNSNEINTNIRELKDQLANYRKEDTEIKVYKENAKKQSVEYNNLKNKRKNFKIIVFMIATIVFFIIWRFLAKDLVFVISNVAILLMLGMYLYWDFNQDRNRLTNLVNEKQDLDDRLSRLRLQKIAVNEKLKNYDLELHDKNYEELKEKLDIFLEQSQDLDFIQKQINNLEQSIANNKYSANDIRILEKKINDEKIALKELGYNVDELAFNYKEHAELSMKFENINNEVIETEREINALNSRLNYLLRNPRTGELESPTEQLEQIDVAISDKTNELAEAKSKYHALAIAQAVLADSVQDFRKNVLPKLNISASGYMQNISNGKYKNVYVSDELNLLLRDKINAQSLEPDQFSSGTKDQVWLAYRLALIDYLSSGINFPLLLDDLFINFDDKRILSSIELLMSWSEIGNDNSRQIILFTCHKHISTMLKQFEDWNIKVLPKNRG